MKKQTKRTLLTIGGIGVLYWLWNKQKTTPPQPSVPDAGSTDVQSIITETQTAAVASPYRDATV